MAAAVIPATTESGGARVSAARLAAARPPPLATVHWAQGPPEVRFQVYVVEEHRVTVVIGAMEPPMDPRVPIIVRLFPTAQMASPLLRIRQDGYI